MHTCSYRSLEPVLAERLATLQARRHSGDALIDAARQVASRRQGRALGGGVATLLGLAAFAAGLSSLPASVEWDVVLRPLATCLLLGAWAAGLGVAVVAGWFARAVVLPRLDAPVALSGNPAADLARVQALDPVRVSLDVARRWELASVALPMTAISILSPLTVHWLVWLLFGGLANPVASGLTEFGSWIGWSAVLVGHAHLAVVVGAVRWARSLRTKGVEEITVGLRRWWGLTLLAAMGVASLPGLVLLAIPPMLVGLTGILFLPAMFGVTARAVQRERMALEGNPPGGVAFVPGIAAIGPPA